MEEIPLVYSSNLPLVYNRLYWVNRTPLAKLITDQNPKKKEYKSATGGGWKKLLQSFIMTKKPSSMRTKGVLGKSLKDISDVLVKTAHNKNTNDDLKFDSRMSEAAEVANAMRRKSKKNSGEFNESLDKKSIGKKRMKRSLSEKPLANTTETDRFEENETDRLAEKSKDVRTGEKLTVNPANLNLNAVPHEPNRDVTNSEHTGFKIVIPPPIPRRHKYVPIFRDCNKKNHTPEEEAVTDISTDITNPESKQSENPSNNERVSQNLNLSTDPESKEESYEEVDKTVEFIKVNDSGTSQSQEKEENNSHDESGISDKSSQIRVSTDSSTEEISDDEDEEPNAPISQEKKEENDKNAAKVTESQEAKFQPLLFDINEYRKPFDLDEFLANDPIFKRIGVPTTEEEGKPISKSVRKQNAEDKLIQEPSVQNQDSEYTTNSRKELKDMVENNDSGEDFLLSFLNKKKSSSLRQKPTIAHEDEREFLSRYFTKDIMEKLRENSKEDERAQNDEQQEEIYNTLSGILRKRSRTPSFSEELREKKKEEEEKSPRAYKSFWSLEYASPHAEAADAEGQEA